MHTITTEVKIFLRCEKINYECKAKKGPGGTVDGKEVQMNVAVGDQVIYSKYAGTNVEIEDEEYIIVRQDDILAICEQ